MSQRICPQCGLSTAEPVCPEHGCPTMLKTPAAIEAMQAGVVIGGRYKVEKLLGRGGFGAVYKCQHVSTLQDCVLKVLKPDLAEDETQVKRFFNEARASSKLSHPNTVRVYDFGQTDTGLLYIAMELLSGVELSGVLQKEGKIDPVRAMQIGAQVLKSLAEAHQAGLVHRDLKPDNIFLCKVHGEDDFVKVIDFGIAKPMDQAADAGLTRTGFTVGTPKYMSPEQVLNKPLDGRSDLYALGVILYQAIAGEVPLQGASSMETLMAHLQQDPAPLQSKLTATLPAGLNDAVMRALRKQPWDRFVDAEDMRATLEEILSEIGSGGGGAKRAMSAKMRAVAPLEQQSTAEVASPNALPPRKAPAPALDVQRPSSPTVAAAPTAVGAAADAGLGADLAAGANATELLKSAELPAPARALAGASRTSVKDTAAAQTTVAAAKKPNKFGGAMIAVPAAIAVIGLGGALAWYFSRTPQPPPVIEQTPPATAVAPHKDVPLAPPAPNAATAEAHGAPVALPQPKSTLAPANLGAAPVAAPVPAAVPPPEIAPAVAGAAPAAAAPAAVAPPAAAAPAPAAAAVKHAPAAHGVGKVKAKSGIRANGDIAL